MFVFSAFVHMSLKNRNKIQLKTPLDLGEAAKEREKLIESKEESETEKGKVKA